MDYKKEFMNYINSHFISSWAWAQLYNVVVNIAPEKLPKAKTEAAGGPMERNPEPETVNDAAEIITALLAKYDTLSPDDYQGAKLDALHDCVLLLQDKGPAAFPAVNIALMFFAAADRRQNVHDITNADELQTLEVIRQAMTENEGGIKA